MSYPVSLNSEVAADSNFAISVIRAPSSLTNISVAKDNEHSGEIT